MENINLRKYEEKDKEFVYQTKKNSYIKYIENHFGIWNDKKQREYFEEYLHKSSNDTWIIEHKKERIGFYNGINMENDNYIIGNICIIPQYQNKGIGTQILKDIIEKHKDDDIFIQYFKENPVGNLYNRLGFIPKGETQFHYQMVKPKEKKRTK